jgi:hypothetical protein
MRLIRSLLTGGSAALLSAGLAFGGTTVASASGAGGAVNSSNWSGYVGGPPDAEWTMASANWVQPAITCPNKTSEEVTFWVGIDGYSSSTVEHGGTLAKCTAGKASYSTWWQMYPGAIQIVGSTVHPGDKISASVTRTGTKYTLKVTDATTGGNSFTKTETCSTCKDDTVEWISGATSPENDPSEGTDTALPDFGKWTVTSAALSDPGGSGHTLNNMDQFALTMVGSKGDKKATPSKINSEGTSFSVTWKAST